jgi:hypothetical protein
VLIEMGKWWVVEAETFLASPKLEAYTIAGQRSRGSKVGAIIGSAAMLGVGVVAVLAYLFWPTGTPAPATPGQPILAAGTPVARWPVGVVELRGTGGPSTTIRLDPAHTTGCAGLPTEGLAAGLEQGAVLPLRLCVRGLDLTKVDMVALFAQGDLPTRRYRRTTAPVPDVELHTPNGVPWFGALLATEPIADHALGDAVSLDAETMLLVTEMMAAGPAEDSTLPADQMRVSVTVSATTAVDWAALAPTLLSARGDLVETSTTEASADGAQLRYVVPLTAEPLACVWRVTRADGSVVRWRVTLSPPSDRPALLRSSLTLLDASAFTTPDELATVQLALVVRNDGRVPLVLQAADLVVTRDGQPVALGTVDGITEPLDPGGTRTLTTTISAPTGSQLTISLGAARRALSR